MGCSVCLKGSRHGAHGTQRALARRVTARVLVYCSPSPSLSDTYPAIKDCRCISRASLLSTECWTLLCETLDADAALPTCTATDAHAALPPWGARNGASPRTGRGMQRKYCDMVPVFMVPCRRAFRAQVFPLLPPPLPTLVSSLWRL